MQRDVPIAYGRGDEKDAALIKNAIFSSYIILCAIAVVLLWGIYLAGVTFKGVLDLPVLAIVTLVFLANRTMSFLEAYIKAEGKFMIIGKSDLLVTFLMPVLNIPAVILFKLKGALLAVFMTNLIASAYYLLSLKAPRLRFEIHIRKTARLLKTGLVLFINKISESVFWNVDIMVLTAMTATKTVGLYSMALNTMGTAEPFSQAYAGLDWKMYVNVNPRYLRPTEVDILQGDSSKALNKFGWRPRTDFKYNGLVESDPKASQF